MSSRSSDAVDTLAWGFVENPPATVAGAAALLAYLADIDEADWPEGVDRDIYRMLAGVLARTAGGAS